MASKETLNHITFLWNWRASVLRTREDFIRLYPDKQDTIQFQMILDELNYIDGLIKERSIINNQTNTESK